MLIRRVQEMARFIDSFGMTEWRTILKMREDAPLMETMTVSKTYSTPGGPVHALRGVSLKVRQGEFSAVVGPSGSGKSTMIHILAGLIRPTEGRVLFKGLDLGVGEESVHRLIREEFIGLVFQDINLVRYLTARENVELPMDMMGIDKKERRRRSMDVLEDVGLVNRSDHYPSEMSGGELQRVAIARALALNPALVLADEPTANMDSATAKRVVDLMAREREKTGRTFLFVTHDPLVTERCDRVLSIRDGTVLDKTTPIAIEVTIKPLSYFTKALFERLRPTLTRNLAEHPYRQGDRVMILETPFEVRAPGIDGTGFLVSETTELHYVEGDLDG